MHERTCAHMFPSSKVHSLKVRVRGTFCIRAITSRRGFPGGSAGKESACNVGDMGSILGLKIPWRRKGYPLQYSGLENSMECIVHGVAKLDTTEQLSHNKCEKENTCYSNIVSIFDQI